MDYRAAKRPLSLRLFRLESPGDFLAGFPEGRDDLLAALSRETYFRQIYTDAGDDLRPAIVCDDVQDLDIFGLRAHVSPTADSVIRCRQVQGALIHGCRTDTELDTFLRLADDASGDINLNGNDFGGVKNPQQGD